MSGTTDVLVIGAGPTGLTTAIELARRGVQVRIVERRTEPSTTSKALVVHARTLELLDTIELTDELVQRGYTSPGIDFSAFADKPLRADMHKLAAETRFPYILILPQAETEAALERRLDHEGVKVERGITLKTFAESVDGITATLDRGGVPETVQASYLVGADGPHSTVRQTLGIAFEGSPYGWTAFLGDVTLKGHDAEGGTEQHSSDRGLAFIVPFEDGSHRIVTIDEKYQNSEKKRDLELGELQESISAILGKQVALSNPKWLTRWGADLKLAEHYGRGRAFLAGDAAHTHSPAGGQGMNTGIQDAFNLGWKLAQVVRGQAPASLLDTYDPERHAQGRKVLRVSDLLLRSLLLRQPVWRKLREALFDIMIPLPPVQHQLAMNLSGLGVRYSAGEGLAGTRMPDVELRTTDSRPQRLYERLRHGKGVLLIYLDPKHVSAKRGAIENLIAATAPLPFEICIVLQNGVPAQHQFAGADTLVDYRGELESRLGIYPGRTVLVRPDGYMAVDMRDLDVSDLQVAYAASLRPARTRSREERALAMARATTRGPATGRALTVAGIFAASGLAKLLGAAPMRKMLAGYGYDGTVSRLIGAWELAGAGAIAAGRSRTAGAMAVAALCTGAAATHVRAREPGKLINALLLLGVVISVGRASAKPRLTASVGIAPREFGHER